MKRAIVTTRIMASRDFWSMDVNTLSEIKKEIQRAIAAGTTVEDIDDYLSQLIDSGKLNDRQADNLLAWAAPRCVNGTKSSAVIQLEDGKLDLDEFFDQLQSSYDQTLLLTNFTKRAVEWTIAGIDCSIMYSSKYTTIHEFKNTVYRATDDALYND